tara:strand:+ start:1246 stop:1416 length:171 start_codon:yes stop_codon:yes gene_type:complete
MYLIEEEARRQVAMKQVQERFCATEEEQNQAIMKAEERSCDNNSATPMLNEKSSSR